MLLETRADWLVEHRDALAVEKGFATREQIIRMRGGDPRMVPAPAAPPVAPPAAVVPIAGGEDDDEDDSADTGT